MSKNDQKENQKSGYMGSKEAAKLWNITQSTVTKWCRVGLIDGAEQDSPGSPWRIPRNASRPYMKEVKR